ncbi:MAG: retaining beta-glycosidase [Phycisphaerales bacterium]|nr:retaining beta-glycosidase [Phycisphaerales bacterium]
MKNLFCAGAVALLMASASMNVTAAEVAGRWPAERANEWYRQRPWLVGANYLPSTAINQLEMWQAETFDLPTIDRELGWAQQLGFTSMRVFLHHLPYEQDSKGFLDRIDQFLGVADKHGIGVMLVIFDSCWDPYPKLGRQREPKPGLHNSGWVQSPGLEDLKDPARMAVLEAYVRGVVARFRDDKRVHLWDIFNEPDNKNGSSYGKLELANKVELTLALLQKEAGWIREINPSQPITTAPWMGNWGNEEKLSPMERVQLDNSDVISFHNYGKLADAKKCVENLKRYGRPIVCSEYMARPMGSTFDPVLGYFAEQRVGAYNWGFVSGKSQTIYPWDSWQKPYASEPPVWFHDIFRADGTAYRPEEVAYIKRITAAANAKK